MKAYNLLTEEIKSACLAFIMGLEPGEHVITIKDKKETRSAAQLRLKWMWMGFLEKELIGDGEGRSSKEWNSYFKRLFIKPILLAQDESFAELFAFIRKKAIALKGALSYEDYTRAEADLWDEVKTEWLHVREMRDFMDKILKHAAEELGVVLPIPDDLRWLYEDL